MLRKLEKFDLFYALDIRMAPRLWNALENSLKSLKSVKHFCKHL